MIKPLFKITAAAVALSFAGAAVVCRAEIPEPADAVKKLGLARETLRHRDEPEKALSLLGNLENEIPELKDYVFFVRAEALRKSGNPAAAETYRKAKFHPSHPLKAKALEREAETLGKNGLTTEAEKIYKTLLGSAYGKRKDFYLKKTAEIAAGGGRGKKAAEIWELIWKDHPASGFAASAPEKIAALGLEFSPSEKTAGARADRLFKLKKWKKALAEYESLPQNPERNVRRAVCVYITGKRNPEKLKNALALLQDTKSAEGLYRKGIIFEAMAKIPDDAKEKRRWLSKAGDVFKSVQKLFPESERAGASLARAQKIALGAGRTGDAEKIYSLVKKFHPSRRAEAAWNLGWAYYKKGKYRKAVRIFSENRRPERYFLGGQFKYWTARIFEKTGKKDEAQALFLKVASRKHFSYYSFLASKKTGYVRDFPKRGKDAETANIHPAIKRARLLLEAGLSDWAVAEARIAGKSSPAAACEILAAARRFNSCIRLVGGYPPPERARLAFPKGFEREVEKFSMENGLDATLVYSLIREESRFDMTAASRANAFGLMQLIMPTAKEVAELTGAGEITRKKLFLPEVNIKLGARYLAAMVKKFNGDTTAAFAGYNAGPSRVSMWKNGLLKGLERDEFTEEIPFAETRNYVRRIFRSYGAYKIVYAPD